MATVIDTMEIRQEGEEISTAAYQPVRFEKRWSSSLAGEADGLTTLYLPGRKGGVTILLRRRWDRVRGW